MMPFQLTKAVKALLIIQFVAFIIQQTADQFFGANLLRLFALVPSGMILDHRLWQIFTYSFLHGDVLHLFLNLMMLAFIGGELESIWGTKKFLQYFFFCTVFSGLIYLLFQIFPGRAAGLHTPMVGSSGGIYGLLVAYGILFGERVLLFMMLFPMKAKHFIWVLATIEFMTSVFSPQGGLASVAHLAGMAGGFGYLWTRAYWVVWNREKKNKEPRTKKSRKRKHLRLIIDNVNDFDRDSSNKTNSGDPKTWH